ncbi:MAG: helix-turn-helix domain-containing protein [Desulfitobacteriaceae bacterium]
MNRIKEIMKSKGITQRDLESMTGIGQGEISRILNDLKPKLTLVTAKKIAKALNCTVEYLWPD